MTTPQSVAIIPADTTTPADASIADATAEPSTTESGRVALVPPHPPSSGQYLNCVAGYDDRTLAKERCVERRRGK